MPRKTASNPLFSRIQQVTFVKDQKALAELLGKSQTSVSKALNERNRLPRDYILEIARRTNANPEWIRTGTGHRWAEGGPNISGLPARVRAAVELALRLSADDQATLELTARVLAAQQSDISGQLSTLMARLEELIALREAARPTRRNAAPHQQVHRVARDNNAEQPGP